MTDAPAILARVLHRMAPPAFAAVRVLILRCHFLPPPPALTAALSEAMAALYLLRDRLQALRALDRDLITASRRALADSQAHLRDARAEHGAS